MPGSAFPAAGRASAATPIPVGGALRLRPAHDRDLDFLRRLYGAFRAAEMAPVPWSDAAKTAFLDDQFRLQHRHFTTVFPDGDFLIVERAGTPIGRLYLHRARDGVLVVDIGLTPDNRGRGLGRRLMEWVLEDAAKARAPRVWLHVLPQNIPARRLYERLGFTVVGEDDFPMRMERPIS